MIIISFDQDNIFEKQKCIRHDRHFLLHSNCNTSKSSDEIINEKKQYLVSKDLNQICNSILFFAQNASSINLEILNEILSSDYQSTFDKYDCLEIYDCINKLVEEISKCSMFLENTDFAMIIIKFLIDFSNIEEKQFQITAYQSISNFIFANKDIASFLSTEFLNECFNRFLAYIEQLKGSDGDDWDEIDNILSLIESILRIFSAMFFHQELISPEFSDMVVKCFHILLDIQIPKNHELKLKTFIIDNAYWFALSAPDESIQNLLSPSFVENIVYFLEFTNDQGQIAQNRRDAFNTVKVSLFETIEKITEHDDQFSLFFLQPPIDLLNRMNNCTKWENEVKYSFLKILSNFTACKDLTPSFNMIESSKVTEFLKSIIIDSTFATKREAFITLFNMVFSKNALLIEYFLTNFSESFQNMIDFLNTEDFYFNTSCLYSIYICYKYLETQSDEMKTQFIDSFKNYEWVHIFESCSSNSDEKLSKLSHILIDIIESSN